MSLNHRDLTVEYPFSNSSGSLAAKSFTAINGSANGVAKKTSKQSSALYTPEEYLYRLGLLSSSISNVETIFQKLEIQITEFTSTYRDALNDIFILKDILIMFDPLDLSQKANISQTYTATELDKVKLHMVQISDQQLIYKITSFCSNSKIKFKKIQYDLSVADKLLSDVLLSENAQLLQDFSSYALTQVQNIRLVEITQIRLTNLMQNLDISYARHIAIVKKYQICEVALELHQRICAKIVESEQQINSQAVNAKPTASAKTNLQANKPKLDQQSSTQLTQPQPALIKRESPKSTLHIESFLSAAPSKPAAKVAAPQAASTHVASKSKPRSFMQMLAALDAEAARADEIQLQNQHRESAPHLSTAQSQMKRSPDVAEFPANNRATPAVKQATFSAHSSGHAAMNQFPKPVPPGAAAAPISSAASKAAQSWKSNSPTLNDSLKPNGLPVAATFHNPAPSLAYTLSVVPPPQQQLKVLGASSNRK